MAAKSKTEVATKQEAALAVPMDDLLQDAGAGNEELRSADIQIPTLVVVQKMSPQLDEDHEAFVAGAKTGDIVNTLTGDLSPGSVGIEVIPCHFRPVVNHVQPTATGSDFIATYQVSDECAMQRTVRSEDGRWDLLEDGSALMQVAMHFVIPVDTMVPAVIRMKRSSMPASKRWNSLLEGFQPLVREDGTKVARPRFGSITHLTTSRREKDGNVFCVWVPHVVREASAVEFYAGRDLYRMVKEGRAVAPDIEEQVPF